MTIQIIIRNNHLTYRRNNNEKCYEYVSKDFTENDGRSSSKRTAEIMCKFFQKFDNEYIVSLQERYFYNKTRFENKCRALVGDTVLVKEEIVPRMNWRKGKIDKLIFGNDGLVRGVELLAYQSKREKLTKIKRPVQLAIPIELCDPNEPAEAHTHSNSNSPRRFAAINVNAIRRASDH